MVTIQFPDRKTEKQALAFLLGRFSGRVLRSGGHLIPEAALEALADQNILPHVIRFRGGRYDSFTRARTNGTNISRGGDTSSLD